MDIRKFLPKPKGPVPFHFDDVAMRAIALLVADLPVLKPHSTYKVWNTRLERLEAIADILQTPKRWAGVLR